LFGLVWRILLQLLILILLLLGFVLGTQTGLRMAIALAEDVAPDMIHVGGVDGRILGELSLRDLKLTLPGLDLALGKLHLDWNPGALLAGRVDVTELTVADVDIVAAPSEEEKDQQPFELPQITLPVEVELGKLLVERLSFRQTGAPPEAAIQVQRAELSASAAADRVDLRRLTAHLTQPAVQAEVQGSARLTGDYPIALDLRWQFEQAPALSLSGKGKVSGDLAALKIDHRVTGSADITLDATVNSVLSAPAWTGNIKVERVDLPQIVADAPPVNVSAQLQTSGNLDEAGLTGNLSADAPGLPDFGQLSAELDLGWLDQVLAIRALKLNETRSAAMLDLAGSLDLSGDTPAFVLAGVWERLRWPFTGEALAESPLGKLDVDGTLDSFSYVLDAQAFGQQIPETRLLLNGIGDAASTRIDKLSVETLGGTVTGKGSAAWSPNMTWDLALTASDLDPGLQWSGLDGTVALKADSRGGLADGFDYQLKLDANISAYPAAVVNLSGSGSGEQTRVDALTIETLGGVIEGRGELAWAPELAWTLRLEGNDLDPGQYDEALAGRVSLALGSSGGLAQGFAFDLKGKAELNNYPPAAIDIIGTGTAETASVDSLLLELLGGRINGSADVAWVPEMRWDAVLTLADIDPGTLLSDWPGRIGGRLESAGTLTDAGPQLTARISDLSGELRGYPVGVDADAELRDQTLQLRRLLATSGSTRLSASGSAGLREGQALDLQFDLDSPDLGTLLPDAMGRLAVKGRLGGSLAAPTVALTLQANDAEFGGNGIERLAGSADVGLGPGGAFQIDLEGADLVAGGLRFETLAVNGSGSMASHRLDLALDGDTLSLNLDAEGALGNSGAYSGALRQLALDTSGFGTWSLQRPARYGLDQGRISVGPLCVGNADGSGGCVSFEQQQPGVFDIGLDVPRIGLEILNPLLPQLLVMNGFVSADAKFTGAGDVLTGSARVEIPTGEIEIALPDTKDKLVFSTTRLALRAGASGVDATLAVPVQDVGRVDGKVSLPGFSLGGLDGQAVRGNVAIRLANLARISNLFPDLSDITGAIDGDIDLLGTLAQPDSRGQLAVRDVGLRVPLIGLEVSQANLTAVSRGAAGGAAGLSVDGGALIGGGQLQISGRGVAGTQGVSIRVEIEGDKLKVADSKEYFALVSTRLEAGFGPGGGALKGQIDIPRARIMPRTIPSGAIQPSPDVVMESSAEGKDAAPFHIDVLATLGDDVSIEAFGLRGKLAGSVRATKEPNRPLLGDGQLEVVDGTYRVSIPGMGLVTAIGKPLTIEQGIVVFAKTPLDDPGLILNAQREGGDVTAGVRVLGTLRNPKLAFFSESDPDLTQAEITSYLVTGVPPKRDTEADTRALSVGTYIAPKLFVEYESSLGDQSDKVKLRYDLTKKIEVQTETGDTPGVDIFYKFEN
jgi:translocation and assembly module TamB